MRTGMNMKSISLLIVLALAVAGNLAAVEADGGYAGAFLQVPIGARPTGMGGAYLALSNDAAGALFNPAGLSSLSKPLFGTSYRAMALDRKLGYVGVFFPTRGQSALGINWLYAGSGSVEVRRADNPTLQVGDISLNSHLFGVLFAKRFSDLIAVGTKLSYFHSTFAGMKAYSVSFDFGGMFYLSELVNREKRPTLFVQDLQVGIAVKNIAAKLPWNTQKYTYSSSDFAYEQDDKVPVEAGLGVSGRFINRKLIVAADFRKADKQHVRLYSGAEFYVTPDLALRTGYGDKRFTAGAGFMFKFADRALAIDYAFSSDKVDEGSDHIFSFDLLF